MTVPYPNRRLGFARALTAHADAFDTNVWANIALANLRTGEDFCIRDRRYRVVSITEKRLSLEQDGKKVSLSPIAAAWSQFIRDAGGELLAHLHRNHHFSPAAPGGLWSALCRDPAFSVRNGFWTLQDALAE